MPAARWWAFEEGDVHFGDLAAAPGDLGRLLVADYATVYGNDWFSIPLRVPTGTLAQVRSLRVHDTMGGHLDIPPAATLDTRARGLRAFRLYELTGDPSVAAGFAPLLFVAPSLSGSSVGPALERVELARDEAANLAWAIERLVEGATGLPVDRLQHWRAAEHQIARTSPPKPGAGERVGVVAKGPGPSGRTRPGGVEIPHIPDIPDLPEIPGLPDDPGRPDGTGGSEVWRYRLETTAPPYWVPFVPVRIGSGAQIRLRRARMQEWGLLDPSLTGPKGELLQRHQPMVIEEEEVPRAVPRSNADGRWPGGPTGPSTCGSSAASASGGASDRPECAGTACSIAIPVVAGRPSSLTRTSVRCGVRSGSPARLRRWSADVPFEHGPGCSYLVVRADVRRAARGGAGERFGRRTPSRAVPSQAMLTRRVHPPAIDPMLADRTAAATSVG